MIFNTHTLDSPLDKYIESIFHFKDFIPDHSIERVVPTGHIFLIFELDGFSRNTFDNSTMEANGTFTNAWISGTHRNYISISAHEKSEMFVIQFKPYGAYPFLDHSVEELNEKILPAENIFGNEIINLRTQFLNADTSEVKFEIAEDWLNQKYNQEKSPPQELLAFYHNLQKEPASVFDQLSESYPKTQKHLISQFKKYIGLTPKYAQRILRFNEILQMIHRKEEITWAHIAYKCGFSDQSYFIKEFKHFSGFNPEEFIKKDFNQDEVNFFPLDR